MPFHGAGEAFTNRRAGHVNELTCRIMLSGYFRAHLDQVLRGHPKFRNFAFWLDLCHSKVTAHCLRNPFGLDRSGTELDSTVAVLSSAALRDDLQAIKLENSDRNLFAIVHEQPGHTQFFGDYTRAHV